VNGSLLDTNVLSEFSRSAYAPDPNVKRWVEAAQPSTLFVSVLSFGEIRFGIELLAPGKKRSELEYWLNTDPEAGLEATSSRSPRRFLTAGRYSRRPPSDKAGDWVTLTGFSQRPLLSMT
jgi:predicted nucleic acid-binding protein